MKGKVVLFERHFGISLAIYSEILYLVLLKDPTLSCPQVIYLQYVGGYHHAKKCLLPAGEIDSFIVLIVL